MQRSNLGQHDPLDTPRSILVSHRKAKTALSTFIKAQRSLFLDFVYVSDQMPVRLRIAVGTASLLTYISIVFARKYGIET